MRTIAPAFKRRLGLPALLVLAVTLALLAAAKPHVTHAVGATIYVTTNADEDVLNGSCSLREAIVAANTNAFYKGCRNDMGTFGANDQIQFLIGISGHEIDIGATPLPAITQWVTIDGHDIGSDRVIIHGPGGPLVSGANGLTVAATAFGTTISSLVINNSADDGILVQADEVTILDSFIGTDELGEVAVPNQGFGVQVQGNADFVGLHHPPASGEHCGLCGNLISGNMKSNILLDRVPNGGPVATQDYVHENQIGTTRGGVKAMPGNTVPGVEDKGLDNIIGGQEGLSFGQSCTGLCNIISGNGFQGGVLLDANAVGSIVEGNFIGTDSIGQNPLPNTVSPGQSIGIVDREPNATIGGTSAEASNLISGNNYINIDIEGLGALVEGNFIGTNSAGTAAMNGNGIGVFVNSADSAQIGVGGGHGNLIGGNSAGIELSNATNAQVLDNFIGLAPDGTTPIPNSIDGVLIRGGSNNNSIGFTIEANYIADNGGDGVDINNDTPTVRSNSVRGNSIFSNGGKGIELQNGANDSVAPPVIQGAGPLHGTSCSQCYVDIYSDSGDEGRVYEGFVFSSDGNWTFTDHSPAGPNVTATNTDISNNTSEFSTPFVIFTPTPSPSPTHSPTPTPTPTPTGSPVSGLSQGDVNCDGAIDSGDFAFLLEFAAGLNDGATPGSCPIVGMEEVISGYKWGDVNCDGSVNALDALYVLDYKAQLHLLPSPAPGCFPLGTTIT